jgi:hypothetical protein
MIETMTDVRDTVWTEVCVCVTIELRTVVWGIIDVDVCTKVWVAVWVTVPVVRGTTVVMV